MRHGELVALMGESGSGKTSLLNVLSGRANYGHVDGEIQLNGRPLDTSKLRHLFGYVPQEPLLHRELTVRSASTAFHSLLQPATACHSLPQPSTTFHSRCFIGSSRLDGLRTIQTD